jgi:nitrogen-specific signal transduction histidine kinase
MTYVGIPGLQKGCAMFWRKKDSVTKNLSVALDALRTNVMVADCNFNIVYMNPAVVKLMKEAEADLREELPEFNVNSLIGSNIDIFHKHPEHQRRMLTSLS